MKKKGRNCAQEGTGAKEDSTGEHRRADSHLSTVAVRGLPLPGILNPSDSRDGRAGILKQYGF